MATSALNELLQKADLLTPDEVELYFQNRSQEASQLHMFDQPSSPEKWERIWSDVEAS